MLAKMNSVKRLYFTLITLSVISTITLFYSAVHYCCRKRSISNFPKRMIAVQKLLILPGNEMKVKAKNDLQMLLEKCSSSRQALVVNIRSKNGSKRSNFVFTTENLPDAFNKALLLKANNEGKTKQIKHDRGYFFVFSFSGDQLSAATRRLFRLNTLAAKEKRLVVEPLVNASLFFGDQLSRKRPQFKLLSLYYDMPSLNNLLDRHGYAKFATRQQFLQSCRGKTGSLYVRLLPNEWLRKQVKTKPKIASWVTKTAKKGWLKCPLPLPDLKYYALMKDLRIVRQICVNTDSMHNFTKLHEEILKNYKCVIFHHWSGTGKSNGNYFQPQTPVLLSPLELTHLVPFSSEIVDKARQFISHDLRGMPYIAVHLRVERFFRTSSDFSASYARFRECSEYLLTIVTVLKRIWKINQIFLTSDLGELGSSAMKSVLVRVSGMDTASVRGHMKELLGYQEGLVAKLKPVVTRKESGNVDKGVEALVDMNILKNGEHLVTMGTGMTWQLWLIDVFRNRQKEKGKKNFNVVKLC